MRANCHDQVWQANILKKLKPRSTLTAGAPASSLSTNTAPTFYYRNRFANLIIIFRPINRPSESRIALKKVESKAKANAAQGIPELIQTAINPIWEKNAKKKHEKDAKYGWYRYDVRFAIPVYSDTGKLERYNIFAARLLVNHSANGKKYLYDILNIKKETSRPQHDV
jgi:hypothetical protein